MKKNEKLIELCGREKIVTLLLFVLLASFVYADQDGDNTGEPDLSTNSAEMPQANTYCPVMEDMKVDTQVFTDYKGKRVYFCCLKCRASFEKDSEKYLHLLPQFAAVTNMQAHEHNRRRHRFSLGRFIEPLGITTLSLLVLTAFGGLFRRKLPRGFLKWHKRLGIMTLIIAILHATLVLIAH